MSKHGTFFSSIGILIILVSLGGFLRFWDLGEQSLWIDEGFTLNAALSIAEKGLPVLDSGKFYKNGILSSYFVAATESIFGIDPFNPWAARVPAALFGTALIAMAYFLYKELFEDEKAALLVAGIMAFSYWEIAWSRQIRGYVMCSFFILAAIFFLVRYVRSHKGADLAIGLAAFGFAYLSQETALALVPAILVLLATGLFRRISANRTFFIYFFATVTLVLLALVAEQVLPNQSPLWIRTYLSNMPQELLVFIIGAIAASVWALFQRPKNDGIGVLSLTVFTSLALIMLFSPASQIRYLFPLFPLFLMMSVYFIRSVIGSVFTGADCRARFALAVGLTVVLCFSHLTLYPRTEYLLESGSPQPDFKTVYGIIKSNRKEGDIVISGFTQLHKVYLGEKGTWLKMNFNGNPSNVEKKIVNGLDYYVAAPVISTTEEFKSLIEKSHGYVIFDSMTKSRLREIFMLLESDPRIEFVYTDLGKKSGSTISLYKF